MVFLSKTYLKIEEYRSSIKTTSLVSSKTSKTSKYPKHDKYFAHLIEITKNYAEFITPEDIIFVAIHLNEQIFRGHGTSAKIASSAIQITEIQQNFTGVKSYNHHLTEATNITSHTIQQFLLLTFSLILQKGNRHLIQDWISFRPEIFKILQEQFISYQHLLIKNSDKVHMDVEAMTNINRISPKVKPMLTVPRQNNQFEDLNHVGHTLLNIKLSQADKLDKCLVNKPIPNEILNDAIKFCKSAQFWSGYLRVLKQCTIGTCQEELGQILKLGDVKILSVLNMMKSKDDCIHIIDHCNAMETVDRFDEGKFEINLYFKRGYC